jgi:hypothetical protein
MFPRYMCVCMCVLLLVFLLCQIGSYFSSRQMCVTEVKLTKHFGRNVPTGRRDNFEEIICGWEDNIGRNSFDNPTQALFTL